MLVTAGASIPETGEGEAPGKRQSTKIRRLDREPRRAVSPRLDPQSSRNLNQLADLVRSHRRRPRSRWRRLDPGSQALLTLAHQRNGDTYTRLAAADPIDRVSMM